MGKVQWLTSLYPGGHQEIRWPAKQASLTGAEARVQSQGVVLDGMSPELPGSYLICTSLVCDDLDTGPGRNTQGQTRHLTSVFKHKSQRREESWVLLKVLLLAIWVNIHHWVPIITLEKTQPRMPVGFVLSFISRKMLVICPLGSCEGKTKGSLKDCYSWQMTKVTLHGGCILGF